MVKQQPLHDTYWAILHGGQNRPCSQGQAEADPAEQQGRVALADGQDGSRVRGSSGRVWECGLEGTPRQRQGQKRNRTTARRDTKVMGGSFG